MNYKNVKFAVDHLVFRKIIGYINSIISSIVNKIKSIIEKFTNIENQVLEITDDNWADYITPRPKIIIDDVNNTTISTNTVNCGKLIVFFRNSNSFKSYTGNDDDIFLINEDGIKKIIKRELNSYVYTNDSSNSDYNRLFSDPYVIDNQASGISNNKKLAAACNYFVTSDPEIIVFNGQLKPSSNIQKIIFNCKKINFIGLSILPGEFKLNDTNNTNFLSNSNSNLNGRTLILLQKPADGVDLSTFTKSVDNDSINFISNQRIVSFSKHDNYIQAFYIETSNQIDNTLNRFVNYWGGLDTDSSKTYSYYGVEKKSVYTDYKQHLYKFDYFSPNINVDLNNKNYSNDFSDTKSKHYCTLKPSTNDDYICLSENLFGTFGTDNRDSNIIPRLRPGRAVELVWYNGYWYAK